MTDERRQKIMCYYGSFKNFPLQTINQMKWKFSIYSIDIIFEEQEYVCNINSETGAYAFITDKNGTVVSENQAIIDYCDQYIINSLRNEQSRMRIVFDYLEITESSDKDKSIRVHPFQPEPKIVSTTKNDDENKTKINRG